MPVAEKWSTTCRCGSCARPDDRLPEYRALRGTGSILDAIADPELASEVTMQPVRRYGVDAAILFSDIVVPYHAIGFGVDIVPGRGPVIAEPFASAADLARLRDLDEDDIAHVTQTIDRVVDRAERRRTRRSSASPARRSRSRAISSKVRPPASSRSSRP